MDVRQEVRGSLFRTSHRAFDIVQHREPTQITMFGAFRLTNPLSGGLLWYVALWHPIAHRLPHLDLQRPHGITVYCNRTTGC
jgi:hypothetical protein